jgi:hypothetical protein
MFHLNIMIYVDVTLMSVTFNYNKVKIYNVWIVCCTGTIYHLETIFKTQLQYDLFSATKKVLYIILNL